MTNCVVLEGNLTADAQTKNVGETTLTEFTIANNRFAGKDKPTKTLFRTCKAWGGRYAAVAQYLTKGKRVTVTAVEEDDHWEKDGVQHWKPILVVQDISLSSDSRRSESDSRPAPDRRSEPHGGDDFTDDIPF